MPTASVAGLVNTLGIANATITDDAATSCSKVNGALAAGTATYQIVAQLCFRADATFIAEAMFGAPADAKSASDFVASVRIAVPPAAQKPAP